MAEYIEREALIKRLEHEVDCSTSIVDTLVIGVLTQFVRDERLAPTVDVVEVVRCKDCEHFGKNKKYRNTKLPISFCDKFHHNITTDNDFCSYGTRKEGADFCRRKRI